MDLTFLFKTLAEVLPQPSKMWFTVFCFSWGTLLGSVSFVTLRWDSEGAVLSLIMVFVTCN